MVNYISIITHRGLEPSKKEAYPESSFEAFKDQISRGFGIEFDPNFCMDGIIINHDQDLNRITKGRDTRKFSELKIDEISKIRYGDKNDSRIPTIGEILCLIEQGKAKIHAIHLKGIYQTREKIDLLIKELINYPDALDKIILFDIKPAFARYIHSKITGLSLAASVAHGHDIERYNSAVKGTLISLEDALKYKNEGIYSWVWLDEWDTLDAVGKDKKFYTLEVFSILRKKGYKIALVTPELHGTSPGLLGGEAHKDASNQEVLFTRISEILSLHPDAICTDWPEEVSNLRKKLN